MEIIPNWNNRTWISTQDGTPVFMHGLGIDSIQVGEPNEIVVFSHLVGIVNPMLNMENGFALHVMPYYKEDERHAPVFSPEDVIFRADNLRRINVRTENVVAVNSEQREVAWFYFTYRAETAQWFIDRVKRRSW